LVRRQGGQERLLLLRMEVNAIGHLPFSYKEGLPFLENVELLMIRMTGD